MFSAPYSMFIKFDICNPYKSAASTAYVLFFCAKFKLIIGGFLHFQPGNFTLISVDRAPVKCCYGNEDVQEFKICLQSFLYHEMSSVLICNQRYALQVFTATERTKQIFPLLLKQHSVPIHW